MHEFRDKVHLEDAECLRETDKALLDGEGKHSKGTLVVSLWIAKQKKLA